METPALPPLPSLPLRKRFAWEIKGGALAAALGAGGAFYVINDAILKSHSSTAAIGYIFVPFIMAMAAVPAFIAGVCATHLVVGKQRTAPSVAFAVLFLALAPVLPAKKYIEGKALEKDVAAIKSAQDTAQLREAFGARGGVEGASPFVAGAVALHPQADEALLLSLASSPREEFLKPLGSLFDVKGENHKGHAVLHLVGRNKAATVAVLRALAARGNDYVLSAVIANKNCPQDLIEALLNSQDFSVQFALALNPRTPVAKLLEFANGTNSNLSHWARQNPSFPAEVSPRSAAGGR